MAKVQKPFVFKHVQYNPGDELDLDVLDPEDKADLTSRGYFTEPQEVSEEKPKATKKVTKRSKTK